MSTNTPIKVPLSAPLIEEDDIKAVTDVLRTRWLSLGPKLPEFEKKIATYVGTKYAVAVNSGTSALHLAIRALGIGEGDEVIVTPFTFVASANCILFERATPVFVDIERNGYNIDPARIEEKITPRTKAIITVDVFGRPTEKETIAAIARRHKLKIIEDSAEALGAEYKKRKVGSFGDCAIFAFYPNKQMTTGEGGVLVTDNEEIYKLCISMRNQGRGEDDEWLEHIRLGFNYRLSDINCALGISQLRKIERLLAGRKRVAERYNERLKDTPGVRIPAPIPKEIKISWFVYVIEVKQRDRFIEELKARGIGCAPYFKPIHLMRFYREAFNLKEGMFPVCEAVAERTLALPFHSTMTDEEIDFVCQHVAKIAETIGDE